MTVILVVLVGGGLLAFLWWRRRQANAGTAGAANTSPGGAPAAITGSSDMRFRVGMTIPIDPSPFLLAAGATKVAAPDAAGGMLSVEAVGVLMDGRIPLNRLYLPGGASFLQLHLDANGQPDECRYFSRVDNVTPATPEEWGLWLDPAQGMIGWPQFQTKDGKLYDRAWAPGGTRIPPRQLVETIQDLRGTRQLKLQSMLYAAPTGAAAPAPQTEFILVSAVDADGEAYVEIHAGIDINPAAITLPAVALNKI